MAKIISAHDTLPATVVITGYLVSRTKPSAGDVIECRRVPLSRVYTGHGMMRAETGESPKKGFGALISRAEISEKKINQGYFLWLRVES